MFNNKEAKEVVRAYTKFLVLVYALYAVFLVFIAKGDEIGEWISDRFDRLKAKFKRHKTEDNVEE